MVLLQFLTDFFVLATVASIVLYLLTAGLVRAAFRRRSGAGGAAQPASVLIPVCGLEDGARGKWEAFCRQEGPEGEVLFGVLDLDDRAVPLLRELEQEYPGRVRLVHCAPALGVNHQVSNLIHLSRAARHDVVVLTDSDMRVTPDYVRTVTAPLADPRVGLVTCAYFDHHPSSLGAAIAALGRTLDFLPHVLVAKKLDGTLTFALGATLATRRSLLEETGALLNAVDRIGSDYHIGNRVSQSGYRVELSTYVLDNHAGPETLKQVWARELRWARTIRMNRGPQFYGLGFTCGPVMGSLAVLASGFEPWAWALLGATLAVRWGTGLAILRALRAPGLVHCAALLPFRDLVSFAVWAVSLFGTGISWRGRRLRVLPGGRLQDASADALRASTQSTASELP